MKKLTLIALLLLAGAGCRNKAEADGSKTEPAVVSEIKAGTKTGKVIEIKTVDQFKEISARKNRLMVFDLYADWCGPCKMLAPILKETAASHGADADFYKINTDSLPQLARLFPSEGIPHVVFYKDSTVVNAYTGLYPKEAYEQAVEILSQPLADTASGTLADGVRRIQIKGDLSRGNILSYRGDKVELTVKGSGKPFSVSVEMLGVSGSSDGKSDVKLTFETKELGFMPVIIADSAGRNDKLWLGVIQYGQKQSGYREVDAEEFSKAVSSGDPLLLDVRTPGEYAEGHIKGSKLIPVQELQQRIAEIADAKSKTVLVYCRSGNRSTAASKILQDNGFASVVNLRTGIKGWEKASLPVEK